MTQLSPDLRSAIITAARAAVEEEDYQWGLQLVDMILDSAEVDLKPPLFIFTLWSHYIISLTVIQKS